MKPPVCFVQITSHKCVANGSELQECHQDEMQMSAVRADQLGVLGAVLDCLNFQRMSFGTLNEFSLKMRISPLKSFRCSASSFSMRHGVCLLMR